jgi:hypothetical protein
VKILKILEEGLWIAYMVGMKFDKKWIKAICDATPMGGC